MNVNSVLEVINLLAEMLPDRDACVTGFLIASSRLGFKQWGSATDGGFNPKEALSCAALNSMGQQGVIQLGSGGREILALNGLFNLSVVRAKMKSLL